MARLPSAITRTIQRRIYEKENRKIEERIIQSETYLRAIFENASDGFLLMNKDATILAFNNKASKYVLLSKINFQIGQSIYNYIEESRKEFFEVIIKKALNGESVQYDRSYQVEDGSALWINFSITPVIEAGLVSGICITGRDITEKRIIEEERENQRIQEQKKIARAIIKAQEKERNYLGQELHDNINQILASTKLYLEVAGNKNEEIKELISFPMELIKSSIDEIRLLCSNLVTPLKNIDLEEQVRKLLSKLEQNSSIKIDFIFSVSNKLLTDDLKLNIYRILQELLHNIAKHANANKVSISIFTQNNLISVEVADDGKGFDVNKKRKGIGISNIINRVESFNGNVTIESSPGKGCRILIQAPY
jgi:PAS domain S-box-containing protein